MEEKIRTDVELKSGERIDDLQREGYRIIQDPDRFCFGMDAVLLSAFASADPGARVLDLGTGTGVIPILMAARYPNTSYAALEIQEDSADMAERSVAMNGLKDRIQVVNGDIKKASLIFGGASFHVVTCNPPYMNENHGLTNPEAPKAIARHELLCTLEDVAREASACLVPGGKFFMVHRPHRLVEILETLRAHKLEPKRLRMVHPYPGAEAKMVLIEASRNGKPWMKAEPPLIIYEAPGQYTEEVYTLYYR